MTHSKFINRTILVLIFYFVFLSANAAYIFIPMDKSQNNHLKAYGIAYYAIDRDIKVDWLLNYQGGSFMMKQHPNIEKECNIRNVSYKIIADIQSTEILKSITSPSVNQDIVRLEKAPKIAIYSPKNKQPWDDAVTMALTYAEIPYEVIYDYKYLTIFFLFMIGYIYIMKISQDNMVSFMPHLETQPGIKKGKKMLKN